MTIFQAVVLGAVQGLTEFLPVSSSGHLVLVPALLGWEIPSVSFNVFLHMGTLVAVVTYFRRDLMTMLRSGAGRGPERRFIFMIIVATIPAAVVGALGADWFENSFSEPKLVAGFLLLTALILSLGELAHHKKGNPESDRDVNTFRALAIGAAQAFSILPGVSRSGSTISAGAALGLARAQAARFSFLMSIPILAGTAVFKAFDAGSAGPAPVLIAGIASSAIVGYLSIAGFLRYLSRGTLFPFAVYCVVAGVTALLLLR